MDPRFSSQDFYFEYQQLKKQYETLIEQYNKQNSELITLQDSLNSVNNLLTTYKEDILTMASLDLAPPKPFNPDKVNSSQAWIDWKESFTYYLEAKNLDTAPGKRKVALLLHCLSVPGQKLFRTFTFKPEIVEDRDAVPPVVGVPAEDKNDLQTVLGKFDEHYGKARGRHIKRNIFLARKQRDGESVMSYIAELKVLAKECDFGTSEDSFIIDKCIDGILDQHTRMRLLDLEERDLTMDNLMRICAASEFTSRQVDRPSQVHAIRRGSTRGRRYSSGRGAQSQRTFRSQQTQRMINCSNCNRRHALRRCPAFGKSCYRCHNKGHFQVSKNCPRNRGQVRGRGNSRYSNQYGRRNVHSVSDDFDGISIHDEEDEEIYTITANVNSANSIDDDWIINFTVNDKELPLQVDSGAKNTNIIHVKTVKNLGLMKHVRPSNTFITGILGKPIKSSGKISIPLNYLGNIYDCEFQILNVSKVTNLLGRVDSLRLGLIRKVFAVKNENPSQNHNAPHDKTLLHDDHDSSQTVPIHPDIQAILKKYHSVFTKNIGCIPGEVDIKVNPDIPPVNIPARPIPVSMRSDAKKELERLERLGVIRKVTKPTKWVLAPVWIRKKDRDLRLCIDSKPINKAIMRENFPMADVNDVITRLHGKRYFTVLDCTSGFFQLRLSQRSQQYTTFSTPFGRWQFTRLQQGLSCSPEIFSRRLKELFAGIDDIELICDDILISSSSIEDHCATLQKVLQRAQENNLTLNFSKRKVCQSSVSYVGHKISADGVQALPSRVKAITEMPNPSNLAQLESLLGAISYCGKFLPNLSSMNAPLRELKKTKTFKWEEIHQSALDAIKAELAKHTLLAFFDVNKDVLITTDSSRTGLGAALIQDGKIVCFASRALTPAETRYAQIELEMLSVVFACEKFHKYIYGKRGVIIENDHKPLEILSKKPISASPMRIQKMLLKLQPYDYVIKFKKGVSQGLPDALSRLPLKDSEPKVPCMDDHMMVFLADTVVGHGGQMITKESNSDPEMLELKKTISDGWPETRNMVNMKIRPYWDVRDRLSVYEDIIFKGEQVLIPPKLRSSILSKLHVSHQGIQKTKRLARDRIYWPGMSRQIEDMVSRCPICLEFRDKQQKLPLQPHEIPCGPWLKLGSDLFEIGNETYVLLVDYYSNWIEYKKLSSPTAYSVIGFFKEQFSRFGIPNILVTDCGSQYTSHLFKMFAESYGFRHITSSPYHQQSNGLSEASVKILKRLIKKCRRDNSDIGLALLNLRNTPRDEKIGSPAQRLLGRRTNTALPMKRDLLQPSHISPDRVKKAMDENRQKQKYYYDRHAKHQTSIGKDDTVRVRTPQGWKPAEVIKPYNNRSTTVKAGDDARIYRRNRQLLLKTREPKHKIIPKPTPSFYKPPATRSTTRTNVPVPQPQPPQPPEVRRSTRTRTEPKWLKDYVRK